MPDVAFEERPFVIKETCRCNQDSRDNILAVDLERRKAAPSMKQEGKMCQAKMLAKRSAKAAAHANKITPASYFRSFEIDRPMKSVAMRKVMLWK